MAYDPDLNMWREEEGWLEDFVDVDWKTTSDEKIVALSKVLDFKERGMTFDECRCMVRSLNHCRDTHSAPLRILETGLGYATSGRVFVAWILKNGGEFTSVDVCDRALVRDLLEKYGYWKHINFIHGSSLSIDWDKEIDFLNIDSAHDYKTCFNEYQKFSKFLSPKGVVGFHDTNTPSVIEAVRDIVSEGKLKLIDEVANISQIGIQYYELLG